MGALLAFLLLILVLILAHEAGHALAARAAGCRVEEFGFGLPPRLFGKRAGETIFSLNALPIGGFVRITGEDGLTADQDPRSFAVKPRWQRALMLSAGILANLLLAAVVFTLAVGLGFDVPADAAKSIGSTSEPRVEVLEVAETPVLSRAGLAARDVLRTVDGAPVRDAADAAARIRAFAGERLVLTVQRDGAERSVALSFSPPKREGERIGIVLLDVATRRVPWAHAPLEGLKMTGRAVALTGVGVARTVRESIVERRAPEDIAGPVGIASVTGLVARRGVSALLEFAGVLSVNLALINALPIPALDGGRLLFLVLDALGLRFLRGRPERLAHSIGFALLLFLLALITARDIQRLVQ